MNKEKRLTEEDYLRLMAIVPDFIVRYAKISERYKKEKQTSKDKPHLLWTRIANFERPKGINPKDWLALIATYQVKTGMFKERKEEFTKKITRKLKEFKKKQIEKLQNSQGSFAF